MPNSYNRQRTKRGGMISAIPSFSQTHFAYPAQGRGREGAAFADPSAGLTTPSEGAGDQTGETKNKEKQDAERPGQKKRSGELTASQQREIVALKSRDTEVRVHEAAHQAAGGSLVGGASYGYATGPDGKRYAVSGEVSIDAGAVPDDPSATIAKMQRVQAAALAPADPSGQDLAVASQAAEVAVQAQMMLAQQRSESRQGSQEGEKADSAKNKRATNGYSQGAATAASQPVGSALDLSA